MNDPILHDQSCVIRRMPSEILYHEPKSIGIDGKCASLGSLIKFRTCGTFYRKVTTNY